VILHTDKGFDPLRKDLVPTNVATNFNPAPLQEDIRIAATRQKKLCLLTIHEKRGHLGFATLKLMKRCGLISSDLATVDSSICSGCTHDKSRRRYWRHKGVRNLK